MSAPGGIADGDADKGYQGHPRNAPAWEKADVGNAGDELVECLATVQQEVEDKDKGEADVEDQVNGESDS